MVCAQCGKQNPETAKVCFNCGTDIAAALTALLRELSKSPSQKPETKPTWVTFIGSTVALTVGWLSFVAGVAAVGNGNTNETSGIAAGPLIIIGALIYRSLKRTQLGLRRPSRFRRVGELIGVVAIVLLTVGQTDIVARMYVDPVPNVVVPVWAIAAYLMLLANPACSVNDDAK